MKVILVTGTSTGIGRECVHHLVRAGCHVVATARNIKDIKDLQSDNVDILPLDVTSEKSMQAAVDATLEKHGRIDGLVNNAGFGAYLPQETIPMETVRQMFEVNVFGLQRLTQMVLPSMRAQQSGRIVNISSVAGHVTVPCLGDYCGTKHAVRAMTGALRVEVRQHGIQVSIVEPGVIKTEFGNRARKETDATIDPSGPYAHLEAYINNKAARTKGQHPRVIARAVRHACTARKAKFRYARPWDSHAGKFVSKFVPDRAWHLLLRLVVGRKSG